MCIILKVWYDLLRGLYQVCVIHRQQKEMGNGSNDLVKNVPPMEEVSIDYDELWLGCLQVSVRYFKSLVCIYQLSYLELLLLRNDSISIFATLEPTLFRIHVYPRLLHRNTILLSPGQDHSRAVFLRSAFSPDSTNCGHPLFECHFMYGTLYFLLIPTLQISVDTLNSFGGSIHCQEP